MGRHETSVLLDDPICMVSSAIHADTIVDHINGLRQEDIIVVLLVVILRKLSWQPKAFIQTATDIIFCEMILIKVHHICYMLDLGHKALVAHSFKSQGC